MTAESSQIIKRMEYYFRDLMLVQCDIGVYIDLAQAIRDFLLWMESNQYASSTIKLYRPVLDQFLRFIGDGKFSWDKIFTHATVNEFRSHTGIKQTAAISGLWRYLSLKNKTPHPLNRQKQPLADVFEQYLLYRRSQAPHSVRLIRRVLSAFSQYLEKHGIDLCVIRIEQVDAFLTDFTAPLAPGSSRLYRSFLRGFLSYLYRHRGVLKKDLAALVTGPQQFSKPKPPKFLRPAEIKKLFDSLELSSAKEIRNYAMVHLAYYLGLRPADISLITLDDISFEKAELMVKSRKNKLQMKLPLPEPTLKAVCAYVVGARPKTDQRRIFLDLVPPYQPASAASVAHYITACMRKAGLSATAYWLRDTYAQNLLETGASIYEIKEMLGHDSIETSQKYIQVHTQLMREVLFGETL
jgi:site-specific recombinase XerD